MLLVNGFKHSLAGFQCDLQTFDYGFWFAMVNRFFSKALSMVMLFCETADPSMPFDVATSGFG